VALVPARPVDAGQSDQPQEQQHLNRDAPGEVNEDVTSFQALVLAAALAPPTYKP